MKAFSLRDVKMDHFAPPFFMENEAVAIRAVQGVVLSNDNLVAMHPEDFSLYEVGLFNSKSGQMEAILPRFILICSSLRGDQNASQPVGNAAPV